MPRCHQHRPARHRRVLHPRQASSSSASEPATTTATRPSACPPPFAGYKRSFGSDGPPGAYQDIEHRRHPAHRGQRRREPSILCPRLRSQPLKDPYRRRPARHQDRHDGRRLPSSQPALRSRAHQRHPHAHHRRDGLYDQEYVTTAHHRLRATLRIARTYTLSTPRNITGLPELIDRTAMLYGRAKAAFIGWTMGSQPQRPRALRPSML